MDSDHAVLPITELDPAWLSACLPSEAVVICLPKLPDITR
jgi:hypothetical protein